MNCNGPTTLVEAYADGELNGVRGNAINKHLRGCTRCADMHNRVLVLRARLHAEVPYYPASPELRARVRATLGAMRAPAPPRSRPSPRRWTWLTGGALAGCTATVLAWVLGTAALDWRANEDLAVDAVTAHVRATLNHDLVQVASSDQHTVKPWLSARLDYSAPVRDLATDGFTLVGGRLDTLKQQSIATLVYYYRLHRIDVFVRPGSAHTPSPQPRTVRGFNVAHATGSGMDWLAVSDVDLDVLTAFVQRLARADAVQ
jgi:anti-sigma factor RsiW